MPNVKVGDLAYIVGLKPPYDVNNGHVVEVLALAVNDPERGIRWSIKPLSKLLGRCAWGSLRSASAVGQIADKYLRPITPGELQDIVENEKELEIVK